MEFHRASDAIFGFAILDGQQPIHMHYTGIFPFGLNKLIYLGVLLVTILVGVYVATYGERAGATLAKRNYEDYFGLSPTRTESGRFLSSEKLGSSEYCGHCHTEIFQQWNASAHHFSSFNNPVYRKVALSAAEEKGQDTLKFCASCHDPLPLLGGEMDNLDTMSWSANAGITCLACHRITEVHGPNGRYVIDSPILHPFALADNYLLQKTHHALVKLTPWLHRSVLDKPFYDSPEFCASCHTLVVPKAINGTTDIVLQDEYGHWQSSHYAEKIDEQSSEANGKKTCRDCHMPLVPSVDPAAKDGMIRSHHFAASNTLLPAFNRDHKQRQAVERFLKNDNIRLTVTGVRRNEDSRFSRPDEIDIKPYDKLEIAIKVRNSGVGHTFPGGTVDSNEAWLEVRVLDANKKIIFTGGQLDQDGELRADSTTFGATFVDRYGNPTDRRTATTHAVAIQQERLIKPGGSQVVYYAFDIPPETQPPLSVNVKLNWRKYSPKFIEWVFDGRPVPELPVTVIAQTSASLDRIN